MKLRNLVCSIVVIFSCIANAQWEKLANDLPSYILSTQIDAIDNFKLAWVAWIDTPTANHYRDFFRTTNFGTSWEQIGSGALEFGVNDMSVIDESRYWLATTDAKILATSDGGINWEEQFYDITLTVFLN